MCSAGVSACRLTRMRSGALGQDALGAEEHAVGSFLRRSARHSRCPGVVGP
jgi:hypothetical protein